MNNGKYWELLVERVDNKRVYINTQGYLNCCDLIKINSSTIKYTNRRIIKGDTYTFQDGTTMSIEEIMVRRFRKEEAKQVDGKLTIIHLDGNKRNRNLGNLKVLEFEDLPTIPHREVVFVDLKKGCSAVFKNKYFMAHDLGLEIELIEKALYKGNDDNSKVEEHFALRDYTHLWFMTKSQYLECKRKGLFDKMMNIYKSNKNLYKTSNPDWYKNYIEKVMENES